MLSASSIHISYLEVMIILRRMNERMNVKLCFVLFSYDGTETQPQFKITHTFAFLFLNYIFWEKHSNMQNNFLSSKLSTFKTVYFVQFIHFGTKMDGPSENLNHEAMYIVSLKAALIWMSYLPNSLAIGVILLPGF